MNSGTLAVTTGVQSLTTNAVGGTGLVLQVIGTGTVIVGGKAGVTAGNGIQLTSANGPFPWPAGGQVVNCADVFAATTTGTASLMWAVA